MTELELLRLQAIAFIKMRILIIHKGMPNNQGQNGIYIFWQFAELLQAYLVCKELDIVPDGELEEALFNRMEQLHQDHDYSNMDTEFKEVYAIPHPIDFKWKVKDGR
jgi:hypothetical protein